MQAKRQWYWYLLACMLSVLGANGQEVVPQPATAPDTSYVLEAGDTIEVRFFYNQELNDTIQIRPDGLIAMPLIGEIRTAGQTPSQLTQTFADRYRTILRDPAVMVQVRGYANRRVFVGGDVMHPGVLPLVGKQTVLGAIIEAGGLLRTADLKQVTLLRRGLDGIVPQTISLEAAKGKVSPAAETPLEPFDAVLVNRSGIAKANQAVDQYIRQMLPGVLSGGFTYLYGPLAGGALR